jgi:macrodomain Ter protein organizer (MatP/YcbG family)
MKRKLIDLDAETERRLSILAGSNGMSLKKYIEYILFVHGNEHTIKIEKEEKKKKEKVKNQLSILDEIDRNK